MPRAKLRSSGAGRQRQSYADLLFARDLAQDSGARFIGMAPPCINADSGRRPWPERSLAFPTSWQALTRVISSEY
jgi:hypothetical protein